MGGDGLVQLRQEVLRRSKEGERRKEAEGFGHIQRVMRRVEGAGATQTGGGGVAGG